MSPQRKGDAVTTDQLLESIEYSGFFSERYQIRQKMIREILSGVISSIDVFSAISYRESYGAARMIGTNERSLEMNLI